MKKKLIELPTKLFEKVELLAKQNARSVNKQIQFMLQQGTDKK